MFSFDFIVFPNPKPMYTTKEYDIKYVAVQNKHQDLREKTRQVPYVIIEHPSKQASTYLIYFHGNAEDLYILYLIRKYASEFVLELQEGLIVNCVVIEYPGYGVYTGYEPSEQLIFEDSLQLYDKIKQSSSNQNQCSQDNNYKNLGEQKNNNIDDIDDIIIFGRSIGSGPAVFLASQRKCKLLITMSAYQSIKQIGKDKAGFLSFLIKDKFNNFERIKNIQCPALLIHGQKDTLINYTHTQKLFNNINPQFQQKSVQVLPKNMTHNDYNQFTDLIDPIIEHCLKINIHIQDQSYQYQQQQNYKLKQQYQYQYQYDCITSQREQQQQLSQQVLEREQQQQLSQQVLEQEQQQQLSQQVLQREQQQQLSQQSQQQKEFQIEKSQNN